MKNKTNNRITMGYKTKQSHTENKSIHIESNERFNKYLIMVRSTPEAFGVHMRTDTTIA